VLERDLGELVHVSRRAGGRARLCELTASRTEERETQPERVNPRPMAAEGGDTLQLLACEA